jgi:hypothetical protein
MACKKAIGLTSSTLGFEVPVIAEALPESVDLLDEVKPIAEKERTYAELIQSLEKSKITQDEINEMESPNEETKLDAISKVNKKLDTLLSALEVKLD